MKKNNQPPKIPNGFDMNPMMMQALQQITQSNVSFFLLGNPEFVEQKDQIQFKKSAINLSKFTLGCTLLGITINVQAKRVTQKIVTMPRYFRYPLRLALMASPFLLLNSYFLSEAEKLIEINTRYFKRIVKFRKTGDIAAMFPDQMKLLEQQNQATKKK